MTYRVQFLPQGELSIPDRIIESPIFELTRDGFFIFFTPCGPLYINAAIVFAVIPEQEDEP